jgi:hypothetical protein
MSLVSFDLLVTNHPANNAAKMTQYTRAAGSHVLQNFLESERAARSDLEKEFLKRPEALKETRENIDRVKSVAFGSLGWVFWLVLGWVGQRRKPTSLLST